jgi:Cu(I)/Ag(I) efflux system membrane fusion protein
VVALGDGRFRAQPVQVGIESGDRVAIHNGVSADDLVVVSGQFLIDSESNIESALRRLDGAAAESADESHESHGDDRVDEQMDHSQHQMGTD